MREKKLILSIVDAFYESAKNDILIGYHFRNIENFETHIPRICLFWEVQLLGTSDQKISPPFDVLNIHSPLHIKKGELGRWLLLFRKTLNEFEIKEKESEDLIKLWREKLVFFESVFMKFFSFK